MTAGIVTITVKKETHSKLYNLQYELTKEEGRKITMDEVITTLLKKYVRRE